MSKTITFYGASDDLVEVDGSASGCDEYGCCAERAVFRVEDGNSAVEVHAIYAGSWGFAVCPQDGDFDAMPNWHIIRGFGDRSSYSETLTINIPGDDVLIKRIDRTNEDREE